MKKLAIVLLAVMLMLTAVLPAYASPSPDAEPVEAVIIGIGENLTAKPGDSISVPISITNNPGMDSFVITLLYDSSVLSMPTITPGEAIADKGGTLTIEPSADGSGYVITWTGGEFTTSDGPLFYLHFDVTDNLTDSTPINLSIDPENPANSFVKNLPEGTKLQLIDGSVIPVSSKPTGDQPTEPTQPGPKNDSSVSPKTDSFEWMAFVFAGAALCLAVSLIVGRKALQK
ncbi:MAG: hypothetical protein IJU16_01655 [Clostridia bacterium]|nr:hypothetical protein [Clostridia bacterium]